jgi:hypothetical protein
MTGERSRPPYLGEIHLHSGQPSACSRHLCTLELWYLVGYERVPHGGQNCPCRVPRTEYVISGVSRGGKLLQQAVWLC